MDDERKAKAAEAQKRYIERLRLDPVKWEQYKAKRRKIRKDYRDRHKGEESFLERERMASQKYHEKNKDDGAYKAKLAEKTKRYTNRKKEDGSYSMLRRERNKRYYDAHRVQRLEKQKQYNDNHKEEKAARDAKWRDANPERVKEYHALDAALRAQAGILSLEDVREIYTANYDRFGKLTCEYCHNEIDLTMKRAVHLDHFYPVKPRKDAVAGKTEIANMRIVCSSCNHSKSNKDPYVWLRSEGYEDGGAYRGTT